MRGRMGAAGEVGMNGRDQSADGVEKVRVRVGLGFDGDLVAISWQFGGVNEMVRTWT